MESFATAEAALALGPAMPAACAVLDHRLPGMDGLALLARLRLRVEGLPAIIITSNASRQVRERTAHMGAVLVEKPLLGDTMVETIRRVLNAAAPDRAD